VITEPTAALTSNSKQTTENITNLKLTTKLTPFANLQPYIELITDPKVTTEPTIGKKSTTYLRTGELLMLSFGSVCSFIVSLGSGVSLQSVFDWR